MAFRWFNAVVIVLWLVAMGWLVSQKVIPPMLAGDPPDYERDLPLSEADVPKPPVAWRIKYNRETIGLAVSHMVPAPDGAEMRSVIRLENLPVHEMVRQFLGSLAGRLLRQSLGRHEPPASLSVATRLHFTQEKRLAHFETVVSLDHAPRMVHLQGDVDPLGRLRLLATGRVGQSPPVIHRQELDLPPDALVGDGLAPRGILPGLSLGQKWTIPTYRPFPPNSPVRIVSAVVERSEPLDWAGGPVLTLVVVYYDEAGSGLSAARKPIGQAWVAPSGEILRQEVMLSNLTLVFDRLPDAEALAAGHWVEEAAFNEAFSPGAATPWTETSGVPDPAAP